MGNSSGSELPFHAPNVRVPENPASIIPNEAMTPRRAHVVRSQIWPATWRPSRTDSRVLTANRDVGGILATPVVVRAFAAGMRISSIVTSYPFGVRCASSYGAIWISPLARYWRMSASERMVTGRAFERPALNVTRISTERNVGGYLPRAPVEHVSRRTRRTDPMCAMTLEREATRLNCPHSEAVAIRSARNAELMRCRGCDQIFARQTNRVSAIRSMWTRVLSIRYLIPPSPCAPIGYGNSVAYAAMGCPRGFQMTEV